MINSLAFQHSEGCHCFSAPIRLFVSSLIFSELISSIFYSEFSDKWKETAEW